MLITLDNRLRIEGVSGADASALRKRYTYSNPKYLELKRLGKWAGRETSTVCYAVRHAPSRYGAHLFDVSLPRGAYDDKGVFDCISGAKHAPAVADLRDAGPDIIDYHLSVTPRDYQLRCIEAVDAASAYQGYIVAPTGSGKTIIGLGIIERCKVRALIVVHTRGLADQWCEAISEFLGIKAGRIGGGGGTAKQSASAESNVIVATAQTLAKRSELPRHGLIVVDECHHTPASTWGSVLDKSAAHFRIGLTATPHRRDGSHHLIPLYLGRKLGEVSRSSVEKSGHIIGFDVEFFKGYDAGIADSAIDNATEWHAIKQALSRNTRRNETIAMIVAERAERESCLVMTDYVDHAELLASMIDGSVLLHGRLPGAQRDAAFAAARAGDRVVVATTGILGEGIDASAWSTLVLALPFTSRGSRLNQAIGRVVRPAPGKSRATIIDLSDDHESCWGAESGRRRFYRAIGGSVLDEGDGR